MTTPEMPEVLKNKREQELRKGYRDNDPGYNGYEDGFNDCYNQLAPLLIEAKKCAEFYGDKGQWDFNILYINHPHDLGPEEDCAGERARELLEKFKENGL